MIPQLYPTTTIPLLIDDVKNYNSFSFTRCNYFVIERLNPTPNWKLGLGRSELPIFLINLSAIITCSVKQNYFNSINDIEETFRVIEDAGFYIDSNDIWLPNKIFFSKNKPKRADVYRITNSLFNYADDFRKDRISQSLFEEFTSNINDQLFFMSEETESFKGFETIIINELKETYPKNHDLVLKWVEKY